MRKTANLESEEDIKDYLAHITKVSKEVDQWPKEKKTRRATVFYKELQELDAQKDKVSGSSPEPSL